MIDHDLEHNACQAVCGVRHLWMSLRVPATGKANTFRYSHTMRQAQADPRCLMAMSDGPTGILSCLIYPRYLLIKEFVVAGKIGPKKHGAELAAYSRKQEQAKRQLMTTPMQSASLS